MTAVSQPAPRTPLSDGIGSVALVQHVGDDKMIVNAARCPYHQAIHLALNNRYTCDVKHGTVSGLKGFVLRAQRRGQQRYSTITLSVLGMPKRQYAVPIHKVMVYALRGKAAFVRGVHVRHLDGNSENNRRENLALGSAAENEADKPRLMKVRAARAARAAQASPHNARFTYYEVISIREHCELHRTKTGRIKRGIVKKLAEHYQVIAAAISAIAVGKNYAS